jgi:hypothetical protein
MSQFDDMVHTAHGMSRTESEESVRLLMRDPRFPAVLSLLMNHRDGLMMRASSDELAGSPAAPTLAAHYLGGVDAILCLEAVFRGFYEGGA